MRRMLIALAGATLLLASACGGDDDEGYTDEMRSTFMSQCTGGAGSDAEDMCGCTYDALVETMPFEDFKEYDDAVRDDPSAALPAEVTAAMTDCATAALDLPATTLAP